MSLTKEKRRLKDEYYMGQAIAQGLDPEEAKRRMNQSTQPILIYVVSEDDGYEGLDDPLISFYKKEDAEKYVKENPSFSPLVINEVALL